MGNVGISSFTIPTLARSAPLCAPYRGVRRARRRKKCRREKCSNRAAERGAHSPCVPQAMGNVDFVLIRTSPIATLARSAPLDSSLGLRRSPGPGRLERVGQLRHSDLHYFRRTTRGGSVGRPSFWTPPDVTRPSPGKQLLPARDWINVNRPPPRPLAAEGRLTLNT